MKNVIFYSPDFSMCFSLLMYLQNTYKVTTTTDIEVIHSIVNTSNFDLVIMDAEPSEKIEELCKSIQKSNPGIHIVLTYVYKSKLKDFEEAIRKYAKSIFYKPFDLNEVSATLSSLTT